MREEHIVTIMAFQAELNELNSEVQDISSTKQLVAKSTLQLMIKLIDPGTLVSPHGILRRYIKAIKGRDDLLRISASEVSVYQIYSLFRLESNFCVPECIWYLARECVVEPSSILSASTLPSYFGT